MGWWILLPIISTILYIWVVAFLLPKLFLRNKYDIKTPKDRGIVKYVFSENGRAVAYQTSSPNDTYIKQYVLSYDGHRKSLKCMLNASLQYIKYDIVLFNKENEIFNVLNVCDFVDGANFTHVVDLPLETSYVSMVIIAVDDKQLDNPVKLSVSRKNVFAYSLITLLLSVFTAFALKIGLVNILGGVFRESIMNDPSGNNLTLWLSVVLSLLGTIIVSVALKTNTSSNNKETRNL